MSKGVIVTAVKRPEIMEEPTAVKNSESAKNSYCIRRSLLLENVDSCADDPTPVLTRIPVQPRQRPGKNVLQNCFMFKSELPQTSNSIFPQNFPKCIPSSTMLKAHNIYTFIINYKFQPIAPHAESPLRKFHTIALEAAFLSCTMDSQRLIQTRRSFHL